MWRDTSFRAKLTLVIVAPVIALVALGVGVIKPKLDDAAAAGRNQDQVRLGASSKQLLDELQAESGLTYRWLNNNSPTVRAEILAQRTKTDLTSTAFMTEAGRNQADERAGSVGTDALQAASTLGAVRDDVDREGPGAGADGRFTSYTQRIEALIELERVLGLGATDPRVVRQATVAYAFAQGKAQVSELRGFLAGRLDAGRFTASDLARATALDRLADRSFQNFVVAAEAPVVTLYRSTVAGRQVEQANSLVADALAAGQAGTTPTTSGDQLWGSMAAKVEAIDAVEERVFSDLLATTRQSERDARLSALVYSAVTAVGVIVAIAMAMLLARSIARRLSRLSAEARIVVGDQLPAVLAMLHNPSSEALARALPEIRADSSDEIGRVAAAFNAVLRSSVEASLQNAQRRAKTTTDMLANLGRRNQALIDQQLTLIDTLESAQRDPALLEDLFRIDHLVTRMRRNAENLLVLADQQTPRPWTDPVPLLDVLRGAAAEVLAIDRLEIEAPTGETAMVLGRFAVDLSHLVAELVENATSYSPPTTQVSLRAEREVDGYRLWVIDAGVGMTATELAEANERLAAPPDIDELIADRVGFQVVGRLARRLDVRVRLQRSPTGGVAASVELAPHVFQAGSVETIDVDRVATVSTAPTRPGEAAMATATAAIGHDDEQPGTGAALGPRSVGPPDDLSADDDADVAAVLGAGAAGVSFADRVERADRAADAHAARAGAAGGDAELVPGRRAGAPNARPAGRTNPNRAAGRRRPAARGMDARSGQAPGRQAASVSESDADSMRADPVGANAGPTATPAGDSAPTGANTDLVDLRLSVGGRRMPGGRPRGGGSTSSTSGPQQGSAGERSSKGGETAPRPSLGRNSLMGGEFDPDDPDESGVSDEIAGSGERRGSSAASASKGTRRAADLPAAASPRTSRDEVPAAMAAAARDRSGEPSGSGRTSAERGDDGHDDQRGDEAVPSDALTAAGLVKRRPGAAFGGNPTASAAEHGAFRRLPTPMGGDDPDRAIAQRRLRVLSELRAGIGRGRDTDIEAVDAAPDIEGGCGPDIDLTDGGADRGRP